MLIQNVILYLLGFFLIWRGASLIISAASKFSRKLKLSPFAFSFVFLGILTSTPEFSVGLQAVADHKASIFVGNLLGGVIVLFLLVIPLLAVFGNGISIKKELDGKLLLATLGVILAPSFLILDNRVTNAEGIIMILLYVALLFVIERKNGIFDHRNSKLMDIKAYSYKDLLKVIVGVVLTFIASHLIVEQTVYFADLLHVPAFYVGLLIIAVGTDLPELTLAIKSVLSGKKQIAMGDYIGAAAVSTLMFGIFTLMYNGEVIPETSFVITFGFTLAALSFYYYLFLTKGKISRRSGFAMIGLYAVFFAVEALKA